MPRLMNHLPLLLRTGEGRRQAGELASPDDATMAAHPPPPPPPPPHPPPPPPPHPRSPMLRAPPCQAQLGMRRMSAPCEAEEEEVNGGWG